MTKDKIKSMKILGIETSCDETALCVIEGTVSSEIASSELANTPIFSVLGTSLFSQVEMHEKYGGVVPMLAKREHSKNLVPLLKDLCVKTSGNEKSVGKKNTNKSVAVFSDVQKSYLEKLLAREPELLEAILEYIPTIEKPSFDAIAVTCGPGLEPALWVGINFAKALGYIWSVPIIPVNHMEGHIVSVLADVGAHATGAQKSIAFPALALLISGGHTELVHISDWTKYEVIGQTRDDAVGEAFDKVARMLSLPYPGGPQISALAEKERERENEAGKKTDKKIDAKNPFTFPRPMINSGDFDFSFSGLKTSVLYTLKKIPELTLQIKEQIACGFEDAVVEVLLEKTKKACEKYSALSLIVGGGVIANKKIRETFLTLENQRPLLKVFIPEMSLATDNAVMIAMAGYIRAVKNPSVLETNPEEIIAQGNLSL